MRGGKIKHKFNVAFKRGLFVFILICSILATGTLAEDARPADNMQPERLRAILQELEFYALKSMEEWKVPGMAISVVKDGRTVYSKAFGVRRKGTKEPVTTDTLFQIGSTTKAFGSTLMGMLADEKKINWNDRVIDHIPGFMLYDPWVTREFTITDLMAHRSGLPDHAGDYIAAMGFDRTYLKHVIRYIKPSAGFRSAYTYNNLLYIFPVDFIEKYWNMSWERGVKEKIFGPLGMSRSSADLSSFQKDGNVACQHMVRPNGEVVSIPVDDPSMPFAYTVGPAGGINSTVNDMAKWLIFNIDKGLYNNRQIISRENIHYVHTPKTIIAEGLYYAMGWIYKEDKPHQIIWHNGDTGGHHAMVAFCPDEKIGIVVLSNLGGENNLPEALSARFFNQYFGKKKQDYSKMMLDEMNKAKKIALAKKPSKPATPKEALQLSLYTGKYSNNTLGTVNVLEKDKRLYITAGQADPMSLRHWDRDTFELLTPPYDDEAGFVFFNIAAGKVIGVNIERFNENGCDELTKIE